MARPNASTTRPLGTARGVIHRRVHAVPADAAGLSNIKRARTFAHPGDRRSWLYTFEGAALPDALTTQDTSSGGSPTLATISASGGQFQILQDNTDEAQNLTLYAGDKLFIDPTKNPYVEIKFKVDFDTLPWSADQRLVAGVGSGRDATLDDMTSNAWFRIDGASANILFESDDGTTDDDDNDSGVDIVDDTFVVVGIDMSNLAAVEFWIDDALVGTTDASQLSSSTLLQPFIEMQKDAGTETEDLRVAYILVEQDA